LSIRHCIYPVGTENIIFQKEGSIVLMFFVLKEHTPISKKVGEIDVGHMSYMYPDDNESWTSKCI
jgi:hypothetical protein